MASSARSVCGHPSRSGASLVLVRGDVVSSAQCKVGLLAVLGTTHSEMATAVIGNIGERGRKTPLTYPDLAPWAEFSYNPPVTYLVFSQEPARLPDVDRLAAQAAK